MCTQRVGMTLGRRHTSHALLPRSERESNREREKQINGGRERKPERDRARIIYICEIDRRRRRRGERESERKIGARARTRARVGERQREIPARWGHQSREARLTEEKSTCAVRSHWPGRDKTSTALWSFSACPSYHNPLASFRQRAETTTEGGVEAQTREA